MTSYSPTFVGVIAVSVTIPGTASCFVHLEHEIARRPVEAGVLERPGELLRGHLDDARVVRQRLGPREVDPAEHRHRDDEGRGNRRPPDLEARMAVDRRAVVQVVVRRAKLPARVEGHARDEREDDHADDRDEPVDLVDQARLGRGGIRQPRDEVGDPAGHDPGEDPDHDHLDDRASSHRSADGPQPERNPNRLALRRKAN
jgi:hypothetical protein